MDEAQARRAVREAGIYLVDKGLVVGTWGNVSLRFDEGFVAITPKEPTTRGWTTATS